MPSQWEPRRLTVGALIPVLLWAMPAAAVQRPAVAPTALVFDGATVVDVERGTLVADQRVVIIGNRIQSISAAGAVPLPKESRIVDARGKYLIPGLWDMHTHSRTLANLFYPLFLANGITGIRDAWSEVPLDTLVRWRNEILAGTRIGPPRQLLNGYKAVNEIRDGQLPFAELVDSLLRRKAQGANFLKVYPLNFTAAAAARRVGLPFGGHVNDISALDASDSGTRILDHVNSAGGLDTLCLMPFGTVAQCRPVAERLRQNGTWFTPTLTRAIKEGLLSETRSAAIFTRLTDYASGFWAGTGPVIMAADSGSAAASDPLGLLSVARQVDLPLLAGTDAGAPIIRVMPPGFSLQVELEMFVAEGLTPLAALQAATLNPARLLGGTDSLGTVAAGKLADLVLLDANPLVDITNTRRIRAVVANGRYFDRATLDSVLIDVQHHPPAMDESVSPFGGD